MIIHSKRFHEVFHAGSTPKLDISLLEIPIPQFDPEVKIDPRDVDT